MCIFKNNNNNINSNFDEAQETGTLDQHYQHPFHFTTFRIHLQCIQV